MENIFTSFSVVNTRGGAWWVGVRPGQKNPVSKSNPTTNLVQSILIIFYALDLLPHP